MERMTDHGVSLHELPPGQTRLAFRAMQALRPALVDEADFVKHDFSTLPDARGRGHGGWLMRWLVDEATRLGCEQLQLDSGVGSARTDAHRLYMNHGLSISSHHFARRLRG